MSNRTYEFEIPEWIAERIGRFKEEYNEKYGVRKGHPKLDEDGNIVGEPDLIVPFESDEEALEYLIDQGLVSWFLDETVSGIPIDSQKMRCPDCGNEDTEKMRGRPGQKAAQDPTVNKIRSSAEYVCCKECGYSEHGQEFYHSYKWSRMDEEEKEKVKEKQEEMAGKMAAWQESAQYQAKQRERNARNRSNRR